MASKRWERWEKIVERVIPHEEDCFAHNKAVKLLARQHAGFVGMVKARHKKCNNPCICCCDHLLAALATHRKGRT